MDSDKEDAVLVVAIQDRVEAKEAVSLGLTTTGTLQVMGRMTQSGRTKNDQPRSLVSQS